VIQAPGKDLSYGSEVADTGDRILKDFDERGLLQRGDPDITFISVGKRKGKRKPKANAEYRQYEK
jgi:hypothetical protein